MDGDERRWRPSMVSYRRTFNLGDYESVQLEESLVIEPREGDGEEALERVRLEAWERVKADVREQAQAILAWRKDKREEALKLQMMQLPRLVREELLRCLQVWVDDADLRGDWPDEATEPMDKDDE